MKIKELIDNLDWSKPEYIQKEAINKLSEIETEKLLLFFLKSPKSTWPNFMKIIKKIGFPQAQIFIPELLKILQDINWPGAYEAIEIISLSELKVTIPLIENAVSEAYEKEDFMWLGGLKLLIENEKIDSSALSLKTKELLEYADF